MIAQRKSKAQSEGWNEVWEEQVYGQGRHLNRYPYDAVVTFIYRHFGRVPDRSQVHIMEVGCGAGNNLWFAAREGFRVTGIDGSVSAIHFAEQRFEEEGLAGEFVVGDMTQILSPDATCDLVIDRLALACNRRATIEATLDEAYRVLKPGGWMFSSLYSDEHPDRHYGQPLGDGTYDAFTGGYFEGLGTTFFASREDIDALFGARFDFHALTLMHFEDGLEQSRKIKTLWQIECRKS